MPNPIVHPHTILKGLDLPLVGAPEALLEDAPAPQYVALVVADYVACKMRLLVREGDEVQIGDALCEDRDTPGLRWGAPAAGTVSSIERGERRSLRHIIIACRPDAEPPSFAHEQALSSPQALRELLLTSGLWSGLRSRPYGRVPAPDAQPAAIFVSALDTRPLAPDLAWALQDRIEDVHVGLCALAQLAPLHFCTAPDSALLAAAANSPATCHSFAGPHPAGLAGLHIQRILPVHRGRSVWHCSVQEVAAIGLLCRSGRYDARRVISLAGPGVERPRHLRVQQGVALDEIIRSDAQHCRISGSVFDGRSPASFLGRYHQQISVIPQGTSSQAQSFSAAPSPWSWRRKRQAQSLGNALHGGLRSIFPSELFEQVTPYDMLPVHLLRALQSADLERAEELGALEYIEEDLALLSFIDPGKGEHAAALRNLLTMIMREG